MLALWGATEVLISTFTVTGWLLALAVGPPSRRCDGGGMVLLAPAFAPTSVAVGGGATEGSTGGFAARTKRRATPQSYADFFAACCVSLKKT